MSQYTFGSLLKRFRTGRLTQQALAEAIKYSRNTISRWESHRNERPPSCDLVIMIAEALELDGRETNKLLTAAGYAPVHLQDDSTDALAPPAGAPTESTPSRIVGDRGVNVGGNVDGNIITGDVIHYYLAGTHATFP